MSEDVSPARVQENAAAAGVALDPASIARVAETVSPTVARFAAEKLKVPLEIEPASFVAIQRGEFGK